MSIRGNKARADRLAREAEAERRARREHLARATAIFRRRLSSPGGLALCFGAGAVVGLRPGRRSVPAEPCPEHGEAEADQEEGSSRRMLGGPLGNMAIRLAAAMLVRYWLESRHGDATQDAGQPDSAAGEMAGAGASSG